MTSTSQHDSAGNPTDTPKVGEEPPPPKLALRTYTYLRLGMIGVILTLAVSVLLEAWSAGWCWQPSISAYYFTPVNAVFVGTLITLGTCMIVIWGRNPVEEGSLNLAGMLAPVVAFVPTADTDSCGDTSSVVAAQPHMDNNIAAYGIVVGAALILLGVAASSRPFKDAILQGRNVAGFWISYVLGWLVWVVFAALFATQTDSTTDWFYRHAHESAAIPLFLLIVGVVIANAYEAKERKKYEWATRYFRLAWAMVVSALVWGGVLLVMWLMDESWDHKVLAIEAAVLFLFAVFWVLQTFERGPEGAGTPRPQ
jgi:hypothetical protein